MTPTMRDVALHAGVSVKTVSRVVNGEPHVTDAVRARVQEAVAELGYQMNAAAQSLRTGRTGVVALGVPELQQHFFAELAEQILREADAIGMTVVIEPTGADREREIELLTTRQADFDGVILCPHALTDADTASLPGTFPTVMVSERTLPGPHGHVRTEDAAAVRAAVDHLVAIGRRDIAVIGASADQVGAGSVRTQAFRSAVEGHGLSARPELLIDVGPRWHRSEGVQALERLVDSGVAFDAVVALNDALALGVLRGASERGVRVPQDVAVVGFDDTDDGRFSLPSLTSVALGKGEIARQAVLLLRQRIDGGGVGGQGDAVAGFHLQRRESTVGVGVA